MKRLCLTILICVLMPVLLSAQPMSTEHQSPRITVTGEAVVRVVPDKITILLGIETWDMDIQNAKNENNSILKKTIDVVLKSGVENKNIQTDHLSVEPRYKDSYRRNSFIGYFVQNSISVTLTDPAQVEQLITGVLDAGVTNIHGINFKTTEFKKHRQEARRLALRAAREKAENMAVVLGKTAGDPVLINEIGQYGYARYYGGWGYGRGQSMSQNVVQNAGGPAGDVSDTIALGKISIKGSVSVTFELE